MKTKSILVLALACVGIAVQAQDVKVEEPKGKAIVQVLGNFHSGKGCQECRYLCAIRRSILKERLEHIKR